MRSRCLAVVLAALATAQDLDWDAIEDAPRILTPSIPVVNAAVHQSSTAFPSQAAAALASPAVPTTHVKRVKLFKDSECISVRAANDTVQSWQSNPAFSAAARNASTPYGYTLAFQDNTASALGVYGYMGSLVLDTYDPLFCAGRCDAVAGCQSFNIYFERDPAIQPGKNCTNPPSVTVIKCVYYGGPVTRESAGNMGQYQEDFPVVVAGSNGYVNNSIAVPYGYAGPMSLGKAAINAPLDYLGHDTYMGVRILTNAPFDVGLCAAACTVTTAYAIAHPPATGEPQTCQFFNTYVLYNGSQAVGQYCALYNETWTEYYATNVGQWRGEDYFSISHSYAYLLSPGGPSTRPSGTSCSNL
ncbi:hypothetical protein BAUCODRAFT_74996 [Baudoinia panamericana UAMH 10762]|uniref:Apple domain-containing protein n=1 Tax=Baudoinia panamericana (strain UAMH 10762) TaxID=717646 RepID=M2MCE8_BAUPA|nr:uncharacterized protein BAUCODRAFT_74996 [Baudoinia panamericana UAMH 10762]EMC94201.1 hypothetical protein BAUCODRAFT_74996 [Baudoinia panamericana UAMH 10762]